MPHDVHFDPAYFDRLYALESESFWFRARNNLILWALDAHFPSARSLCEIGCGTGFFLRGLADAKPELRLSGIDIHPRALAYARERLPRAAWIAADASALPLRPGFDVLCALDVLEHIADDESALREMGRALLPGGGFLLTVPHHPGLWSPTDVKFGHLRRYTRGGVLRLFRAAGFEVLMMTAFVSLLFPALWASRVRESRLPESDGLAALTPPPLLAAVAARALDAERALIRAGLRFPFGGSLLVAARKIAPN
jgi:SAM-dependent methyltransferase